MLCHAWVPCHGWVLLLHHGWVLPLLRHGWVLLLLSHGQLCHKGMLLRPLGACAVVTLLPIGQEPAKIAWVRGQGSGF